MTDDQREWRRVLKQRTKVFAMNCVKLVERMPRSIAADVTAKQLVRSSTSVAANYRAACRARSVPECIAKLGIVEEEADESGFWLEFARDMTYAPAETANPLIKESDELTAIVVTSINKLKARRLRPEEQ